jgi:hypothetical protein
MCDTIHDYRISAFVDRSNDYRGAKPDYRSGSIFDDTQRLAMGDLSNNSGNFGNLMPLITVSPTTVPEARPTHEIPPSGMDSFIIDRPGVPDIQDLLGPRGAPMPPSIPGVGPSVPSPFDGFQVDPIPFSPGDGTVPPRPQPQRFIDTESPITLEGLQRIDPSVRDLQIISIEDVSAGVQIVQ